MLGTNVQAPNFSLTDQNGTARSLDEFKGRYVVVYFYPKDGTPGCVKEACEIRDAYPEFEQLGVTVLGVSIGTPEQNAEFAKAYNLPFTLLSDLGQMVAKSYGANGLFFAKRISYLIDPNGIVVKTYPSVDPATHANILIEDVRRQLSRHSV